MQVANKVVPIKQPFPKIYIDITKVKIFTKEHLDTSLRLSPPERFPKIFTHCNIPGVKYVGRKLVKVSNIDCDNKYSAQEIREVKNAKSNTITEDIRVNGYDLTQLTPAVMMESTGSWSNDVGNHRVKTIDSRTRQIEIRAQGVKVMIVDVFEKMDKPTYRRLGQLYNNSLKEFSTSSVADIKKTVLLNVEELKLKTEKEVLEEISLQSDNLLTKGQKNEIVADAMNNIKGANTVLSFPNGKGAAKWLVDHFYVEFIDPVTNKHIVYITISSMIHKVHSILINWYDENPLKDENGIPYEYRFIIHGSTLDATKDMQVDFSKRCVKFQAEFTKYEKEVAKLRFGGAEQQGIPELILYGTIPMLKSLEHKYPMHKLIVFKQD